MRRSTVPGLCHEKNICRKILCLFMSMLWVKYLFLMSLCSAHSRQLMKVLWKRIWGWLVPQLKIQRLNSSERSVKLNYWLVIKTSFFSASHQAALINHSHARCANIFHIYIFLILHPICRFYLFRGEPVVCISSTAGESLQLPRTLLPPTAHHGCLPVSLSVHDDKVNILPIHMISLSVCYCTDVWCYFFFHQLIIRKLTERFMSGLKTTFHNLKLYSLTNQLLCR